VYPQNFSKTQCRPLLILKHPCSLRNISSLHPSLRTQGFEPNQLVGSEPITRDSPACSRVRTAFGFRSNSTLDGLSSFIGCLSQATYDRSSSIWSRSGRWADQQRVCVELVWGFATRGELLTTPLTAFFGRVIGHYFGGIWLVHTIRFTISTNVIRIPSIQEIVGHSSRVFWLRATVRTLC